MFSERVLNNLARSRRNAFLLRSVCIFASAKARFTIILWCFRRSGVFTHFLTIRQDTYFSSITRAFLDFQRFVVPVLLVFSSVSMTNHDFQQNSRGSYTFCVFETRSTPSVSKEL